MNKGLEALRRTRLDVSRGNCEYNVSDYLDTIEKELKALEIIKEKRVDMWHLMDMLEQDYVMYCAWCVAEHYNNEFVLTQEEFDLLKGVGVNG